MSENTLKLFHIILCASLLCSISGCDSLQSEKTLTPEMEADAKNTVIQYLKKNNLPIENINPFQSKVERKPDFSYLYTGGGRCIEFIIYCNGNKCNEWHKYPYDEHGDKCP